MLSGGLFQVYLDPNQAGQRREMWEKIKNVQGQWLLPWCIGVISM